MSVFSQIVFLKSIICGENNIESYVKIHGINALSRGVFFDKKLVARIIPYVYLEEDGKAKIILTTFGIAIVVNNLKAAVENRSLSYVKIA